MKEFVSLILPLLTSGGMVYLIIQAIIAKRKDTRDHLFESENKMLEQLISQNNELVLFIEKNVREAADKISELASDLGLIRDELTDHIMQETAINDAIIKVLKVNDLNGELKLAEYFIEIEKEHLGEKFKK